MKQVVRRQVIKYVHRWQTCIASGGDYMER